VRLKDKNGLTMSSPGSRVFLTSDGDEGPQLSSSDLRYSISSRRDLPWFTGLSTSYLVVPFVEELEEPLSDLRFELIRYDPEQR
jgi:hypothetical protein